MKNVDEGKQNNEQNEEQNKEQNPVPKPPVSKPGQKPGEKKTLASYNRGPVGWMVLVFLVVSMMMMLSRFQQMTTIRWDEFTNYLGQGLVESVEVKDTQLIGKFSMKGVELRGDDADTFIVDFRPDLLRDKLPQLLDDSGVEYKYSTQRAWLWNLFSMMFPLVIFGAFFYFIIMRNMRGGAGGMLMNFGRSKHKVQTKDHSSVSFKDVAGIEEAKDEVAEIIEFLKNPKRFRPLGGRIPRGVLLVGPPGCGKTLLAKAIAGEADVPFLSISGSDFVEMFVGVGASRVRDLFKQAKESSPCIIFLDEVDAIGRKRSAGFAGGGHDEREQTLNAILVEMDGFDTDDQVIIIAATNRADILDNALTRPGRFDRQVFVPLPDLKGRAEILAVHAKKIKLADNVNLDRIARGTPMFSGAELAAIINEAAIGATMANKDHVELADLEEARDKVRWGRAKRSRVVDMQEKEVTAYHEAGHTLAQSLLKDADPLHKVSIIPRGPMGGATFSLPEKDRTMFTKKYCEATMRICFAGRIAEEIFCGDISSGASADIQQATKVARMMVLTWGMSDELGLINYSGASGEQEMSPFGVEKEYSEKTAEMIDKEIKRLADEAYKDTRELIETHREKVEAIAQALLKYETLDAAEVKKILDGGVLDRPTVGDLLAAEQEKPAEEDKKSAEEDKKS